MPYVIDKDELPHGGTAHAFEGHRYGAANVSFFLTDGPPGDRSGAAQASLRGGLRDSGGRRYVHGRRRHHQGDRQPDRGRTGRRPHKFVNSGTGRTRHIDIHTNRRMTTEWLEG
jgi:hypothetical protein